MRYNKVLPAQLNRRQPASMVCPLSTAPLLQRARLAPPRLLLTAVFRPNQSLSTTSRRHSNSSSDCALLSTLIGRQPQAPLASTIGHQHRRVLLSCTGEQRRSVLRVFAAAGAVSGGLLLGLSMGRGAEPVGCESSAVRTAEGLMTTNFCWTKHLQQYSSRTFDWS